jgi:hypothetical protein
MWDTDDIWDSESASIVVAGVDDDFRKHLLKAKHRLYHSIIFAPSLGTKEAHDNGLLQVYLRKLNAFYVLAVRAQDEPIEDTKLLIFPKSARPIMKEVLDWITTYFQKNGEPQTTPYEQCIKANLHTYQFMQNFMVPQ